MASLAFQLPVPAVVCGTEVLFCGFVFCLLSLLALASLPSYRMDYLVGSCRFSNGLPFHLQLRLAVCANILATGPRPCICIYSEEAGSGISHARVAGRASACFLCCELQGT